MNFVKLQPYQVREIYEVHLQKDFPRAEVKPLRAILSMLELGVYECLGFYDGENLRGYAYLVVGKEKRGSLLLDYLAVCADSRGRGYGSLMLKELKAWYRERDGILIECESLGTPADEETARTRRRRMDFYLSNGCVPAGCEARVYGVEYSILYMPIKAVPEKYDAQLEQVYRIMFTESVMKKRVRIWRGEDCREADEKSTDRRLDQ